MSNTRLTTHAKAQNGRGSLPEKIGKYVIINEVGRGSTGVVYLSHDPYYGRDVAIKVYNVDASGDESRKRIARKMFLSEAHMVGMLQHPNILPIYDAGEENGHCYIVTEHVHGARTLAAYCRPDNLLRIDDVVELVYKAARDFITPEVERVLIDDAEEYEKVRDFMRLLGPQYVEQRDEGDMDARGTAASL